MLQNLNNPHRTQIELITIDSILSRSPLLHMILFTWNWMSLKKSLVIGTTTAAMMTIWSDFNSGSVQSSDLWVESCCTKHCMHTTWRKYTQVFHLFYYTPANTAYIPVERVGTGAWSFIRTCNTRVHGLLLINRRICNNLTICCTAFVL